MNEKINRRDFLKFFGVGVANLTLNSLFNQTEAKIRCNQYRRVTAESISVYQEPSDKSKILFQRFRDEVLNVYKTVTSEDGPGYNPFWCRVWGGYVHSGFIQAVKYQLNPIKEIFPSKGMLMEVTVPFSQSFRHRQSGTWEKFYRLYYSSTHWVFGVKEGPDGNPWYEINDGLVALSYYVPAEHLREVTFDEISPIHSEVNPKDKRIEISIAHQKVYVFEGNKVMKEYLISSGIPYLNSGPDETATDTPRGKFHIHAKRPSVHMGDGTLQSDEEAYELPGVPWVSYFESSTGVAIHGTYWHNNFGMTMSHGCINMLPEDAKWIYRWCTVPEDNADYYRTPVIVY
ncbi:MAG TPA: L,D-transpeptidase [Anaerolineae bacterium]|nr:L,D-transpeptidase [Anaerolineae bacterium]